MQAQRVLFVLNSAGGGASLGIYELVRNLPRDEFVPYAVLPGGGEVLADRNHSLFRDVRSVPMPWWNLNREAGPMRRAAFALGRWRHGMTIQASRQAIVRAICDWDVDLVHTGTALTLGGALAAKELGKPHVWHIKECIGKNNRVQFAMDDSKLVHFMSGLSDTVIAMSNYVARIFLEHGCRNLVIIPDGVDLEHYGSSQSRRLRDEVGVKQNELLVGMVASMTSTWKRHDVFIRAVGLLAKKAPNCHFVVIGPMPSGSARWPHDRPRRWYEGLTRLARACVPPGRLTFVDYLSDSADIMRSLDVLVHPCEIEPFGRIAIEAMACGTPIVGPTTGGVSETVVDGETGLLAEPGDPKAFAGAVRTLIDNAELRQRQGRMGRARVADMFTVDHQVRNLTKTYNAILKNP